MRQKEYLSEDTIEKLKRLPKESKLPILVGYIPQSKELEELELKLKDHKNYPDPRSYEEALRNYVKQSHSFLEIILKQKRLPYKKINDLVLLLSAVLNSEQIIELDKQPEVEIKIDY